MKQTHELMDGVTVEMGAQTFAFMGKYLELIQAYIAEKEITEDGVTVHVANLICYAVSTFYTGTEGMTITDDCKLGFADELRTFAKMVKGRKPVSEWVDFYDSNIHISFWDMWERAYSQLDGSMIPIEKRPGDLLTKDEKKTQK